MIWALTSLVILGWLVFSIVILVNHLDYRARQEKRQREAQERAHDVPYWS